MKRLLALMFLVSACGDDLLPEGAFEVYLHRGGAEIACADLEPVRALVGPVRLPGQAFPILWPDAELIECGDGPGVFIPTDSGTEVIVMVGERITQPSHQALAPVLEVEAP